MNFWKNSLGERIYNLDYELLVENQEIETRKLINYLGLKWDDNCLKHHENDRAIKTASSTQARKPIYKTAIKSSDRYKDYLKNVKSIIEAR